MHGIGDALFQPSDAAEKLLGSCIALACPKSASVHNIATVNRSNESHPDGAHHGIILPTRTLSAKAASTGKIPSLYHAQIPLDESHHGNCILSVAWPHLPPRKRLYSRRVCNTLHGG